MALTLEAATGKDKRNTNSATLEHRHFAFIAGTIADLADMKQRRLIATHFADACATTNPRFDRMRFLIACNVER